MRYGRSFKAMLADTFPEMFPEAPSSKDFTFLINPRFDDIVHFTNRT